MLRASRLRPAVWTAVVAVAASGTPAAGAVSVYAAPGYVVPLPQQAWSIDRAEFVYTSDAGGNADLWSQHGPEGAPAAITSDPAQDHWARWFPDGSRIAFQTLRDGNREIYAMNADGSGVVNLSNHPAQDLLPAVSPDGSRILFFSDRGLDHDPRELPGNLYVMDADGGSVERLTGEPLTSTFSGDWSPDGRTIVFARDYAGDIDLVLLDLESGRERRIPGTASAEYAGRFSPDGRRIAFHASDEGGESRIVLVDVDGGGRRELTSDAQHYYPSWSPDGDWLLVTAAPLGARQFDLVAVSVDDGRSRPLAATDADERSGAWRPIRLDISSEVEPHCRANAYCSSRSLATSKPK